MTGAASEGRTGEITGETTGEITREIIATPTLVRGTEDEAGQ